MPVGALAITAGKAAFSLIPKDKEARKKAAERVSKGFTWVKSGLQKISSVKKTDKGYSVAYGDGKTFETSGIFSGGKKQEEQPMDWMKIAPYAIGALILLNMKK